MATLIINMVLSFFKVRTKYIDKNNKQLKYGDYVCYDGGKTKSRARMKVTAKIWNNRINTCLDAHGENWCYELSDTPSSIIELIS